MEYKICPIRLVSCAIDMLDKSLDSSSSECLEEECAWWNKSINGCVLHKI